MNNTNLFIYMYIHIQIYIYMQINIFKIFNICICSIKDYLVVKLVENLKIKNELEEQRCRGFIEYRTYSFQKEAQLNIGI